MRCSPLVVVILLALVATGTAWAGFTGTDVFLPSVAAQPGVAPSVWYTTVWVHNPSSRTANLTVYLLERRANPAPQTFTDTIPPGDTRRYDDAVQTMFAKQTAGALRVTSNVNVSVVSRVYSQSGEEKDSVGQFFAAVPASFAIGAGETTELLGIRQSQPASASTFRYNFGFVEVTGGGTCTVKVTISDATGAAQGSKTYTVREWEQVQKSCRDEFGSVSTENSRLTVEIISGSGRVIAFGSGVANGSQDPSTFEMAFRDELLVENTTGGISGVAAGHGLTGGGNAGAVTLNVGAGAGIAVTADLVSVADGGITAVKIADGAVGSGELASGAVTSEKIADGTIKNADLGNTSVTLPKLAASGTAAGKVLGSDGSNLMWQDSGNLSLPWSGSSELNSHLFRVTHDSTTTSRAAIMGISSSTSGFGLWGENTASSGEAVGVLGQTRATAGFGIWGVNSATAGRATGVLGQTTSPSGSGVWGRGLAASSGIGVLGEVTTSTGIGVKGSSTSSVGATYGVLGEVASTSGAGVRGTSSASSGASFGVLGETKSNTGAGVKGIYTGVGNGAGVIGWSDSFLGWGGFFSASGGVTGVSSGSGINFPAVRGEANGSGGIALYGTSRSTDAVIVGVNEGTGDLLKLFAGSTGGELRMRVTNAGEVYADGTFHPGGADFAEAFEVEGEVRDYEPGDVLVISPHSDATVERCAEASSTRVAGVVATRPGVLMSPRGTAEDLASSVPLGVVGVIPTKVSAEGGAIRRGDLLVTSATLGHAMKAVPVLVAGVPIHPTGAVLGKALEEFDGPGTGTIRVLVNVR